MIKQTFKLGDKVYIAEPFIQTRTIIGSRIISMDRVEYNIGSLEYPRWVFQTTLYYENELQELKDLLNDRLDYLINK